MYGQVVLYSTSCYTGWRFCLYLVVQISVLIGSIVQIQLTLNENSYF